MLIKSVRAMLIFLCFSALRFDNNVYVLVWSNSKTLFHLEVFKECFNRPEAIVHVKDCSCKEHHMIFPSFSC